jgi:hypothetical protein
MEAGKRFFAFLAGEDSPWAIKTIKASLGKGPRLPKADLVTAVNVFNELFWNIPWADRGAIRTFTEKNARFLGVLARTDAPILVIEPGIPRCGEFISLLRGAFIDAGRPPLSPCPHRGPCPMPGGRLAGGKAKWCHFVCDSADAPSALQRLSAAAGLPKERISLSFILAGPALSAAAPSAGACERQGVRGAAAKPSVPVRIISDAFPLPGKGEFGRYGCSERGLMLVKGKRREIDALASGVLAEPALKESAEQDPKSGALILKI